MRRIVWLLEVQLREVGRITRLFPRPAFEPSFRVPPVPYVSSPPPFPGGLPAPPWHGFLPRSLTVPSMRVPIRFLTNVNYLLPIKATKHRYPLSARQQLSNSIVLGCYERLPRRVRCRRAGVDAPGALPRTGASSAMLQSAGGTELNSGGRDIFGRNLVGEVLGRVGTRSVRVAVGHIVLSRGCRTAAFYGGH